MGRSDGLIGPIWIQDTIVNCSRDGKSLKTNIMLTVKKK